MKTKFTGFIACSCLALSACLDSGTSSAAPVALSSSGVSAPSSGTTLTATSSVIGSSATANTSSSTVNLGSSGSASIPVVPAQPTIPVLAGDSGTFIDIRDQHKYRWIRIGTQVWMRQNLNYVLSTDVKKDSSQGVATGIGKWAPNYDWKVDNGSLTTDGSSTNGRYYTASAAATSCPGGWHLPTEAQFNILAESADALESSCAVSNEYTIEEPCANVLKSKYGWSFAKNGNDTLHFAGLPSYNGSRMEMWSSTPSTTTAGNFSYRALYYHFLTFGQYDDPGTTFKSVRCLANITASSSSATVASSNSNGGTTYTSGTLKIPYKTTSITVPAGTYSPTYATNCTSRNFYMEPNCSVVIGGITMTSIEKYTSLPSSIQLKTSCNLSCD